VLCHCASFFSYFGEIVLKHGPLDIEDPKILDPVGYLPQSTQEMVKRAGGISEVLVSSGKFAVQGRSICPIEDVKMMKDSLSSMGRSSVDRQDLGQRSTKAKDSGGKTGNVRKKGSGLGDRVGDASSGRSHKRKRKAVHEDEEDGEVRRGKTSSQYLAELLGVGQGCSERKKKKKHRVEESEVLSDDAAMHSCSSLSIDSDDDGATPSSVGPEHGQTDLSTALGKFMTSNSQLDRAASSGAEPGKSKETKASASKSKTSRSDMFSPTNSTSSISSSSSSSSLAPSSKNVPHTATQKKLAKGKSAKEEDPGGRPTSKSPQPQVVVAAPVSTTCVEVQTDPPLMKDKWVMTDYQQHVPTENFKEKYELTKKEKKDLQGKLETSEDQKYKMQKNHKRELDEMARKTRKEVMEVRAYVGLCGECHQGGCWFE